MAFPSCIVYFNWGCVHWYKSLYRVCQVRNNRMSEVKFGFLFIASSWEITKSTPCSDGFSHIRFLVFFCINSFNNIIITRCGAEISLCMTYWKLFDWITNISIRRIRDIPQCLYIFACCCFWWVLTVTFVMTRSFQVQSAGEGRIMTYVKVDSLGYK